MNMSISDTLARIREYYETKEKAPYYNKDGFVRKPFTMVNGEAYFPNHQPYDLPKVNSQYYDNEYELN